MAMQRVNATKYLKNTPNAFYLSNVASKEKYNFNKTRGRKEGRPVPFQSFESFSCNTVA